MDRDPSERFKDRHRHGRRDWTALISAAAGVAAGLLAAVGDGAAKKRLAVTAVILIVIAFGIAVGSAMTGGGGGTGEGNTPSPPPWSAPPTAPSTAPSSPAPPSTGTTTGGSETAWGPGSLALDADQNLDTAPPTQDAAGADTDVYRWPARRGGTVCLSTSGGAVAALRVVSLDAANRRMRLDVTVRP